MKKAAGIIIITIWALAIGIGTVWITDYSSRPGIAANSPLNLPSGYLPENSKNLPKLLLFLHPYCPCSRATLTELNRLVEHNNELVDVQIFFYQPADQSREWVETDIWRTASEIPNVKLSVINDDGLRKFGAITSGQALLYDADGNLVFSGGITKARGHEGDNRGREVIEDFLSGKETSFTETPVFGCILSTNE